MKMNKKKWSWMVALLGPLIVAGSLSADPAYPVKVGPTGRYLVDQNGVPFLITGDSPQAMIGNLSEAEAELFLSNRRAYGFNTVWINLLCTTYTGCRDDGMTFDGVPPFTTLLANSPAPYYDLSTPNEDYFARVDRILQLAAQYGFLVILDPAETGGWLDVLRNNGIAASFDYGRFLGQRYARLRQHPLDAWQRLRSQPQRRSVRRGPRVRYPRARHAPSPHAGAQPIQ